nr:MAG: hypothetical protein [Bacteriophage sp.]
MFEQVKDYKSACKVLGIKPIDKRRKLEEHVLVYIQLSTITQAINFIANGNKPWVPEYKQNKPIKTWYNWWYIKGERIIDGSIAGFFGLAYGDGINGTYGYTDAHLRFISKNAAEYAAKTFKPLYMKHIFGID